MIVELGLFLISLFLFNIVYQPTVHLNYWRKSGIPHLKPLPIIGNLLQVFLRKQTVIEFIMGMHMNTKEKIVGFHFMTRPLIFVKDLDLIREVTVKHFDHFANHSTLFDLSRFPELRVNLFSLKGEKWRSMRATLSPAFTGSKMRQTSPLITESCQHFKQYLNELINRSDNGVGEFETQPVIGRVTCDTVVSSFFGVYSNSFVEGKDLIYNMIKRSANVKIWRLFLNIVFGSKLLKLVNLSFLEAKPTNFIIDMLRNAFKTRKEQNVRRIDVVDILLEAQKDSIQQNKQDKSYAVLTDFDLIAQSYLFFFAGYGNVCYTLEFICLELALNPDVQQKLYEQIMTIHEENGFSVEKVISLKYLQNVIKETLRKWPAAPSQDRTCTKDFHTTLDGKPVFIKTGSYVVTSIIGNHYDPKNYPDPYKFDPDRFNEENSKGRHRYAYLSFGAGPRYCIGKSFAMIEMKLVLANLLKDFELVPTKRTLNPIQFDPAEPQAIPLKGVLGVRKRNNVNT